MLHEVTQGVTLCIECISSVHKLKQINMQTCRMEMQRTYLCNAEQTKEGDCKQGPVNCLLTKDAA